MDEIIIIGASDHCRYTIDIIETERKFKIIGILDKNLEKGSSYGGYPVLGYLDVLLDKSNKGNILNHGIVAIGDNYTRKKLVQQILEINPNFKFINAIHPSVIIGKEVQIGVGCVMMAGVIINNNSKIGNHCFLATKASLDHDSTILDFSSLSPGVTTGGRVFVGECTAIGIGATILHYKSIGHNCVIGGSSLVNMDIRDNYIAFGVPVKEIKPRLPADKYL
jgi:sugar O-acyltransferase (sialic acid O-acetyltransferase NeuD family)